MLRNIEFYPIISCWRWGYLTNLIGSWTDLQIFSKITLLSKHGARGISKNASVFFYQNIGTRGVSENMGMFIYQNVGTLGISIPTNIEEKMKYQY